MMGAAIPATGCARHVCDSTAGVNNHCKLLGRCPQVQRSIEVSASKERQVGLMCKCSQSLAYPGVA